MRRLVGFIAACSVLVVGALPGSAGAADPARDSVRGKAIHRGADSPFPRITVRIHASSDAGGSNPIGWLVVRSFDLGQHRRGAVTCLNVYGHEATVGIQFFKAEDPALIGKGELFHVVGGGASGVDHIAGFPITDTPPTACPKLSFNVPVVSGNYRIHDAKA
jgi:hypothetical protein